MDKKYASFLAGDCLASPKFFLANCSVCLFLYIGCLYQSTEIQPRFLRAIEDNYSDYVKSKSSDKYTAYERKNEGQQLKVTLEQETVHQEL